MDFRVTHVLRTAHLRRVAFILTAGCAVLPLFLAAPCSGEDAKTTGADKASPKAKSGIQQIIFEEQKIEGKIRRPQMVLIKADQRPAFAPMVLQSFGKNDNIAEFVDQGVIENMPNQSAFQFNGTKIINVVP